MQPAVDANPLARGALVFDIDGAGRVVADEHGRERRLMSVVLDELRDLLGQLTFECSGKRFAVENGSGQRVNPADTRKTPQNSRFALGSPVVGAFRPLGIGASLGQSPAVLRWPCRLRIRGSCGGPKAW